MDLLNPPADSDAKFLWQGPSLNNYTITNPAAIIHKSATYSISYNSLGGGTYCPYSYNKSISIELIDSCDVEPVFANIFTPNNDGVNDTWGINYKKVSYVKEITYTIYNRWGNLIFEGSAPKMRWDGYTTSGIPCTDGIYFYIVTVKDIKDQIKKYEGNITLIR